MKETQENYDKLRKEVEEVMEHMTDDADTDVLKEASEEYCNMWGRREGYKYAIKDTMEDDSHDSAIERVAWLKELLKKLK